MFHYLLTTGFIATVLLFSPLSVLATNFLQNADFESGAVDPWTSYGGAVATISSELYHGGAVALKVTHDNTSSAFFQQMISDIEGGMFYEVSGYGATKDEQIGNYSLRIAWYDSLDGKTPQLTVPDETAKANRSDGEWTLFRQVVQAPLTAKSAKVRLVLTSKTKGTLASAYFDDIVFQESVAPSPTSTPTPTDAPTPTPASTPTPTKTPTPSPTPKPTPTKTPTPTPTKTPTPVLAMVASVSSEVASFGAILGATASASPAPSTLVQGSRSLLPLAFALALIGLGLALLTLVFIWQKRGDWFSKKDV